MDNANKIISFVLGLIVVVVFIAIVTGRFKIGNNTRMLSKTTPTVAPTRSPKITPTITKVIVRNTPVATGYRPKPTVAPVMGKTTKPNYQATGSTQEIAGSNVTNIPNTGAPTLLIPTALSLLAAGSFLRKFAKKN